MNGRIFWRSPAACKLLIVLASYSVASYSVEGQNGTSSGSSQKPGNVRLTQLVDANVIATHAYQVLLAKKSGRREIGRAHV